MSSGCSTYGGAGGVACRAFTVSFGQTISYSLVAAGAAGLDAGNGGSGPGCSGAIGGASGYSAVQTGGAGGQGVVVMQFN